MFATCSPPTRNAAAAQSRRSQRVAVEECHGWRSSRKARRGIIGVMTDVTQILSQIESGDPSAAEQLLPLVYEELRKLAAAKLAQEKPGQTLQATALVHEAYLRLVDVEKAQHWNSRGHFFAAAAEAMRRILVEQARARSGVKRGGELQRVDSRRRRRRRSIAVRRTAGARRSP